MIHISITYPKPGQHVQCKVQLQGSITGATNDTILRTVTFPQSMQTYHPQTGQVSIDFEQNRWDTVTFVGSADYGSHTGEHFRLIIVKCTEAAEEELDRYLETASQRGWPGIPQLPTGCRKIAEVSVIRDDYKLPPPPPPITRLLHPSISKIKNILAVFANPRGSDSLRLETEDRVIKQCIERSKYRDTLRLEIRHAVTIDDVARALLEKGYELIHFSGHGTGRGLAFENELGDMQIVSQEALANFISRYSPPIECIILNACYTDLQGSLFSAHIPYTIAMNGPISDDAAIEFTRGFYDAIGAGKDIKFAYYEGRFRMDIKGFSESSIPAIFIGE